MIGSSLTLLERYDPEPLKDKPTYPKAVHPKLVASLYLISEAFPGSSLTWFHGLELSDCPLQDMDGSGLKAGIGVRQMEALVIATSLARFKTLGNDTSLSFTFLI